MLTGQLGSGIPEIAKDASIGTVLAMLMQADAAREAQQPQHAQADQPSQVPYNDAVLLWGALSGVLRRDQAQLRII